MSGIAGRATPTGGSDVAVGDLAGLGGKRSRERAPAENQHLANDSPEQPNTMDALLRSESRPVEVLARLGQYLLQLDAPGTNLF